MFYEVHVTVGGGTVERWRRFCDGRGIKPLLIELSEGEHPRQMMCAASFVGEQGGAGDLVERLEHEIRAAGFAVLRTKVECPLSSVQVPGPTAYYECHIKLDLTDSEAPAVGELCRAYGFSSSRDALSRNGDRQKWYLTERHYDGGIEDVREKFRLALERVRERLPVRAMDAERVLYDTNPAMDEGWVPMA